MRTAVIVATLLVAHAAIAEDNTDELVLESARKAGYANPAIIARGDVFVVADQAGDGMLLDEPAPARAIAIGRYGTPLVELGTFDGPLTARAPTPFFGTKSLIQIDIGYRKPAHSPGGYAATHRFVVRTHTLAKACDFELGFDTASAVKGSRTIDKVDVKKVKAKPLTFAVRRRHDRNTFGGPRERSEVMTVFELGDSGTCIEKAKR